jgi:GTPase SAR1 family protein
MQIHHKPTKILIGGKSGSGKTTYLIRFVRNSQFRRYFIFDHKLEFSNRMGIEAEYEISQLAERFAKGEKYLSYHHSTEFPGDVENAFQMYCEWSYEMCKALEAEKDGASGNSLFVCDEVNRFTTTSDLGFGFKQLIEDGRLQGLDMVATSHAQNQISNRLRLQLSEIVTFKVQDSRAMQFLDEAGFDLSEITALAPRGQYIVKNMDNETFERGKLFSCTESPNDVEQAPSDEQPENNADDTGEENKPSVEPQTNDVPTP